MMSDSEDEVSDMAVEIAVSECTSSSSEEECSDGGDEFEMEDESDSESESESDYEEEEEEVKQPRAKKQQPTKRVPATTNPPKALAGKKGQTAVKLKQHEKSLVRAGAQRTVVGRSNILTPAKSSLVPKPTTTSSDVKLKQQYRKPIVKDEMKSGLSQEDEERRKENIKALMSGRLDIHRNSLMPKVLSVQDAAAVLRKPFKSPHPNAPAQTAVRSVFCIHSRISLLDVIYCAIMCSEMHSFVK
jgi:hypothetical protein